MCPGSPPIFISPSPFLVFCVGWEWVTDYQVCKFEGKAINSWLAISMISKAEDSRVERTWKVMENQVMDIVAGRVGGLEGSSRPQPWIIWRDTLRSVSGANNREQDVSSVPNMNWFLWWNKGFSDGHLVYSPIIFDLVFLSFVKGWCVQCVLKPSISILDCWMNAKVSKRIQTSIFHMIFVYFHGIPSFIGS